MNRLQLLSVPVVLTLLACCVIPGHTDALVRLSQADLATAHSVAVGGMVVIALPEVPATGEEWRCTWEPMKCLRLVGDFFVGDPHGPGVAGVGGTRCFALGGTEAGAVVITLQSGRWIDVGQKKPPVKTSLNVTPAPELSASARPRLELLEKPMEMAVGLVANVTVRENPTTGYQWKCTWAPDASLKLVQDDFVAGTASRGLMGAAGRHRFTLQALKAGDVNASLQNGRWWANGDKEPPWRLRITVKP